MRSNWKRLPVSLRTKIMLPVAVILALAILSLAYATGDILESQRRESVTRNALVISSTVEASLRPALMLGHSSIVRRAIKAIAREGNLPRVALRLRNGKYFVDANPARQYPWLARESPVKGQGVIQDITVGSYACARVTDPVDNLKECQSCHNPADKALGYLEVDVPLAPSQQRVILSDRRIVGVAATTLILVGLAITVAMNVSVIRPVRRLAQAMSVVQKGERQVQVPPSSEDEIGMLTKTFNAMVDDITAAEMALVEKEHQLAKAEKLAGVGLMAAGIAHEINNPLAAVVMAAETLNRPGVSEEHTQVLSKSLLEGAQRIQAIVSEMLTLDRKRGLALRPEAPAAIVRQALHAINVPAHIRVHFRIGENIPKVLVDRDKMARALGNIIKNAVQAMPDGGALTLSAEVSGDWVDISIKDTGPGMPPEVSERVFDPFYSTREVGLGFGLGLAVAHGTITQHGGEVSVRSRPGEGTVFYVVLPAAEEDQENA